MRFKERMNEITTATGYSVSKISDLTGINRSLIYKYISGDVEPSLKHLGKLARAFNVSESWLMGYDVEPERPSLLTDEVRETFRSLTYEQQELIVKLINELSQSH